MKDIKELAENITEMQYQNGFITKENRAWMSSQIESILRAELSHSDMDLEAEAISLYKSEFEVTESIIYQYDEEREAHFKDTIRFATKFARTILSRNENINPPKTDEG